MSNDLAAIEVKKHAMRQTQEGSWLLTLSISQDDVPLWLFTAPMGQRMAIAELTIIAEQPTGHELVGSAPSPSLADAADSPTAAPKPKKHWDELKPSQQAGMMCEREDFSRWIREHAPLERWDGESVHTRAVPANTDAANEVRWYCGVTSRSDLDTNPEAAKRWRELHSMFTADTQYGDRR